MVFKERELTDVGSMLFTSTSASSACFEDEEEPNPHAETDDVVVDNRMHSDVTTEIFILTAYEQT